MASADSSCFGKNPVAGLSAIGPAKSAAEQVEIKITAGPPSRWCAADVFGGQLAAGARGWM
jgi:hypothetical protein